MKTPPTINITALCLAQALRYAKAATAVRGAAYKLEVPISPGQLPFVGAATAKQLDEILTTGSCPALDCFRSGG